ncbi:MAG TPA: hypothetical protein VGB85_19025, partial [Nannocystis sp.]
ACAAGDLSTSSNFGVSVTNITVDEASVGDTTDTPTSGTGIEPDASTGPAEDPTTGEPATSEPATSEPATTATTGPATTGPATTGTTGDCMCDLAPDACHTAPGECIDGACVYPAAPADGACDDGDPCTGSDLCDGAGACLGTPVVCEAANATGSCQDGACQFACVAPYEDCDGDWGNGCEVPVGVANQCDLDGLNPDGGCWTAYCGSSGNAKASFGTYYCTDCSNCHTPGDGLWQWCNHATGNWYPAASGTCAAKDEDLVCAP